MNKKIAVLSIFILLLASAFAETAQPKKVKFPVENRKNAYIYMTEIYKTDNWAEYYCLYEEDKRTFKEDEAEKALYEFISNYKRDNVYSSVEVEDLKGLAIGDKTTTMQKRIIFRHVNKH